MELKQPEEPPRPAPVWSAPKAAFAEYRLGMSPYLHHFYDLRASRDPSLPRADLPPDAGADLPSQFEAALRKLIDDSFG